MFLDIRSGRQRKIQPPVDPSEFAGMSPAMLEISAVGTPEKVAAEEAARAAWSYRPDSARSTRASSPISAFSHLAVD
mgnify:CR=1 FL=1